MLYLVPMLIRCWLVVGIRCCDQFGAAGRLKVSNILGVPENPPKQCPSNSTKQRWCVHGTNKRKADGGTLASVLADTCSVQRRLHQPCPVFFSSFFPFFPPFPPPFFFPCQAAGSERLLSLTVVRCCCCVLIGVLICPGRCPRHPSRVHQNGRAAGSTTIPIGWTAACSR